MSQAFPLASLLHERKGLLKGRPEHRLLLSTVCSLLVLPGSARYLASALVRAAISVRTLRMVCMIFSSYDTFVREL